MFWRWVSFGIDRCSILMNSDQSWDGKKIKTSKNRWWGILRINLKFKSHPEMDVSTNYALSECCRICKSHFLLRAAVAEPQITKMCLLWLCNYWLGVAILQQVTASQMWLSAILSHRHTLPNFRQRMMCLNYWYIFKVECITLFKGLWMQRKGVIKKEEQSPPSTALPQTSCQSPASSTLASKQDPDMLSLLHLRE